MDNKFRLLRADEIECRVGQVQKDGFTLVLYKDARCDMDILDKTVGSDNWQRDHKEIKGNLYCGVSIWDKEKSQWITKWDCGTESNTEKEKGEASDSFKRANVNWGIGRELYTSPKIKIKGHLKEDKGKSIPDLWKMSVSSIGYNENNEINHLVIEGDGEIIFEYSNGYTKRPKTAVETTNAPKTDKLSTDSGTAELTGNKRAEVCDFVDERKEKHDRLVSALNYGVQGNRGIKRICDMNKRELEAVSKCADKYAATNAKIVLDAIKENTAFFTDMGIECTPF